MNSQNTTETMDAGCATLEAGGAQNGNSDLPDNIRDALRLIAAVLRRNYHRTI